jgi:hypothetical protein
MRAEGEGSDGPSPDRAPCRDCAAALVIAPTALSTRFTTRKPVTVTVQGAVGFVAGCAKFPYHCPAPRWRTVLDTHSTAVFRRLLEAA